MKLLYTSNVIECGGDYSQIRNLLSGIEGVWTGLGKGIEGYGGVRREDVGRHRGTEGN